MTMGWLGIIVVVALLVFFFLGSGKKGRLPTAERTAAPNPRPAVRRNLAGVRRWTTTRIGFCHTTLKSNIGKFGGSRRERSFHVKFV